MKLRAEYQGHLAIGTPGEVHHAMTAWFATASLDQLALVDQLLLAAEARDPSRHRLAVRLGVDLDEV